MANEDILDLAIGAENLRRMFRQTMAARARKPGESIAELGARLFRDPATARVAKTLGCSVSELLAGFGQEEVFYVEEGWDRDEAEGEVEAIVEKIASAPLGTNDPRIADVLERSRGEQTRTAPHIEDRRGQVIGDERARKQIELARRAFPRRK